MNSFRCRAHFFKFCGLSCCLLFWISCLTLSICGCGTSSASSAEIITQHQVDLRWDAPSSSPVQIVGYHVYRSTGIGSSYQLLSSSIETETVYLDTTVQSGSSYNYFVTSVDASGFESGSSNTVSVTIQ
jgi:fibronectin type 3 domain-containing protein